MLIWNVSVIGLFENDKRNFVEIDIVLQLLSNNIERRSWKTDTSCNYIWNLKKLAYIYIYIYMLYIYIYIHVKLYICIVHTRIRMISSIY